MMHKKADFNRKGRCGFLVDVRNTQNGTWQGTVTWVEQNKTVPFRSALEMMMLMNSAIDPNSEPAFEEIEEETT